MNSVGVHREFHVMALEATNVKFAGTPAFNCTMLPAPAHAPPPYPAGVDATCPAEIRQARARPCPPARGAGRAACAGARSPSAGTCGGGGSRRRPASVSRRRSRRSAMSSRSAIRLSRVGPSPTRSATSSRSSGSLLTGVKRAGVRAHCGERFEALVGQRIDGPLARPAGLLARLEVAEPWRGAWARRSTGSRPPSRGCGRAWPCAAGRARRRRRGRRGRGSRTRTGSAHLLT